MLVYTEGETFWYQNLILFWARMEMQEVKREGTGKDEHRGTEDTKVRRGKIFLGIEKQKRMVNAKTLKLEFFSFLILLFP